MHYYGDTESAKSLCLYGLSKVDNLLEAVFMLENLFRTFIALYLFQYLICGPRFNDTTEILTI